MLDLLVYLLVRLLVATCQAIPMVIAYCVADALAWLMFKLDARHRSVAFDNLERAFPELGLERREQIVRGVYRHFCRMIIEMLKLPKLVSLTSYRKYVQLSGHEPVLDRLLDGEPMIMVTGHFGNWEMAGVLFGLFGFPPCSVARPIDNPYLDQYLRDFRQSTGQTLITKKGGGDQMVEVLDQGGLLSVLADQDAGQRGLFVEYFGRPASSHKAIALLALQHGVPIVVGGARRLGNHFRYEIVCEAVIDPGDYATHPDPVRAMTQAYTSALESLVRRAPEQYLWLHRRWKHQPQPRGRARAA
jgi:KDO2-lipid IV(A) lauroyltransferase